MPMHMSIHMSMPGAYILWTCVHPCVHTGPYTCPKHKSGRHVVRPESTRGHAVALTCVRFDLSVPSRTSLETGPCRSGAELMITSYTAMAYTVMADIVMAYIVMAMLMQAINMQVVPRQATTMWAIPMQAMPI